MSINILDNIILIEESVFNDSTINFYKLKYIINMENLPMIYSLMSRCKNYTIKNQKVLSSNDYVSTAIIIGSQHLKTIVGSGQNIGIVWDKHQDIGVGILIAHLYINKHMDFDNINLNLNSTSNSSCHRFLSSTINMITNKLDSIGFNINTWNNTKVMEQSAIDELFNLDIGKFETYDGIYPSKYKDVIPLSEQYMDDMQNGIMPDKAKNIINRQRKDHTDELINLNEKEMFLLVNGYYYIPNLKNKFNSDKVQLTSKFMLMLDADAYVNTANEALMGGGGTDLLIHRYAGESLKKETSELPNIDPNYYYPVKCLTGDAKITSGHNLKAKYIIHVVTPYLNEDGSTNKQMHIKSYKSVLNYIDGENIKTMVIGPVSTGYYGYPMLEATILGLRTIAEYLCSNNDKVEQIKLWIYNETQYRIYEYLIPYLL